MAHRSNFSRLIETLWKMAHDIGAICLIQLRRQAFLEALRNQQHNLEATIAELLEIMKSLPEGETRDRLFNQISCLDSIAESSASAGLVHL